VSALKTINRKIKTSFTQAVSSLVLICLATTNLTYAQPSVSVVSFHPETSFKSNGPPIHLPSDLGSIEVHLSKTQKEGAPLIVHIEDAHSNYDAQLKIRDIIKHLVDESDFSLILLEGAEVALSPELYQFFEEKERNKQVGAQLVQLGELTGSELYLLDAKKNVIGIGMEQSDMYVHNLKSFRKLSRAKKELSNWTDTLRTEIEAVASTKLPSELFQFLKLWLDLNVSSEHLSSYLNTAREISKKHVGIDLTSAQAQREYPMLVRYFKAMNLRNDLDVQAAASERDKLVQNLKALGVDVELVSQLSGWNMSQGVSGWGDVNPRYFLESLYLSTASLGFQFQDYPVLAAFWASLIFQFEIKINLFLKEIESLKHQIVGALVRQDEGREIVTLMDDWTLLRKLLLLELSRSEFEVVEDRIEYLNPLRMKERLNTVSDRSMAYSRLGVPLGALPREDSSAYFTEAIHFYETAVQRESFLSQNTAHALKAQKQKKAILVTGGFHSDGLKKTFTDQGYSYVKISPRLNSIDPAGDAYLNAMLEGSHIQKMLRMVKPERLSSQLRQLADFDYRHAQVLRSIQAIDEMELSKIATAFNNSQYSITFGFQLRQALSDSKQLQTAIQKGTANDETQTGVRAELRINYNHTEKPKLPADIKTFFRENIRYFTALTIPFAGKKGYVVDWLIQGLNDGYSEPEDLYQVFGLGEFIRGAAAVWRGTLKPTDELYEKYENSWKLVPGDDDYQKYLPYFKTLASKDIGLMERGRFITRDGFRSILELALRSPRFTRAKGIFFDGFPRTSMDFELLLNNQVKVKRRPIKMDFWLEIKLSDNEVRRRAGKGRGRVDDGQVERRIQDFHDVTKREFESVRDVIDVPIIGFSSEVLKLENTEAIHYVIRDRFIPQLRGLMEGYPTERHERKELRSLTEDNYEDLHASLNFQISRVLHLDAKQLQTILSLLSFLGVFPYSVWAHIPDDFWDRFPFFTRGGRNENTLTGADIDELLDRADKSLILSQEENVGKAAIHKDKYGKRHVRTVVTSQSEKSILAGLRRIVNEFKNQKIYPSEWLFIVDREDGATKRAVQVAVDRLAERMGVEVVDPVPGMDKWEMAESVIRKVETTGGRLNREQILAYFLFRLAFGMAELPHGETPAIKYLNQYWGTAPVGGTSVTVDDLYKAAIHFRRQFPSVELQDEKFRPLTRDTRYRDLLTAENLESATFVHDFIVTAQSFGITREEALGFVLNAYGAVRFQYGAINLTEAMHTLMGLKWETSYEELHQAALNWLTLGELSVKDNRSIEKKYRVVGASVERHRAQIVTESVLAELEKRPNLRYVIILGSEEDYDAISRAMKEFEKQRKEKLEKKQDKSHQPFKSNRSGKLQPMDRTPSGSLASQGGKIRSHPAPMEHKFPRPNEFVKLHSELRSAKNGPNILDEIADWIENGNQQIQWKTRNLGIVLADLIVDREYRKKPWGHDRLRIIVKPNKKWVNQFKDQLRLHVLGDEFRQTDHKQFSSKPPVNTFGQILLEKSVVYLSKDENQTKPLSALVIDGIDQRVSFGNIPQHKHRRQLELWRDAAIRRLMEYPFISQTLFLANPQDKIQFKDLNYWFRNYQALYFKTDTKGRPRLGWFKTRLFFDSAQMELKTWISPQSWSKIHEIPKTEPTATLLSSSIIPYSRKQRDQLAVPITGIPFASHYEQSDLQVIADMRNTISTQKQKHIKAIIRTLKKYESDEERADEVIAQILKQAREVNGRWEAERDQVLKGKGDLEAALTSWGEFNRLLLGGYEVRLPDDSRYNVPVVTEEALEWLVSEDTIKGEFLYLLNQFRIKQGNPNAIVNVLVVSRNPEKRILTLLNQPHIKELLGLFGIQPHVIGTRVAITDGEFDLTNGLVPGFKNHYILSGETAFVDEKDLDEIGQRDDITIVNVEQPGLDYNQKDARDYVIATLGKRTDLGSMISFSAAGNERFELRNAPTFNDALNTNVIFFDFGRVLGSQIHDTFDDQFIPTLVKELGIPKERLVAAGGWEPFVLKLRALVMPSMKKSENPNAEQYRNVLRHSDHFETWLVTLNAFLLSQGAQKQLTEEKYLKIAYGPTLPNEWIKEHLTQLLQAKEKLGIRFGIISDFHVDTAGWMAEYIVQQFPGLFDPKLIIISGEHGTIKMDGPGLFLIALNQFRDQYRVSPRFPVFVDNHLDVFGQNAHEAGFDHLIHYGFSGADSAFTNEQFLEAKISDYEAAPGFFEALIKKANRNESRGEMRVSSEVLRAHFEHAFPNRNLNALVVVSAHVAERVIETNMFNSYFGRFILKLLGTETFATENEMKGSLDSASVLNVASVMGEHLRSSGFAKKSNLSVVLSADHAIATLLQNRMVVRALLNLPEPIEIEIVDPVGTFKKQSESRVVKNLNAEEKGKYSKLFHVRKEGFETYANVKGTQGSGILIDSKVKRNLLLSSILVTELFFEKGENRLNPSLVVPVLQATANMGSVLNRRSRGRVELLAIPLKLREAWAAFGLHMHQKNNQLVGTVLVQKLLEWVNTQQVERNFSMAA
jgi:adenylate kinase family enzyme